MLVVVWTRELISLSGRFIERVYLVDLGQASVPAWPADVSSAQGKSLQRLIPPRLHPGEALMLRASIMKEDNFNVVSMAGKAA